MPSISGNQLPQEEDAFHQWQGVVDDAIYSAIPVNDVGGKGLQHVFIGNIAHKMGTILLVDDTNMSAFLAKLVCDTQPDALRSAGHHNHLVVELIGHSFDLSVLE